jgi:hypothetical protein
LFRMLMLPERYGLWMERSEFRLAVA